MVTGHVRGNVFFDVLNTGRMEANPKHAHGRSEMNKNETSQEGQVEATEADDDAVLVIWSNKKPPQKDATLIECLVGL